MEEKNCGLLFEYLRSILYDEQIKPLDLKELDEPYQKLGKGLQYLDKAVQEMKAYSEALSKGRLSDGTPARDNFLCENLKNIHANLNHLTWQAKQVAKGDYSQTVSYLGEFSEAFNAMTRQLKEREQRLKEDAEKEKKRVDIMENYNQLLMELIARSDEEPEAEWKEALHRAQAVAKLQRERSEEALWECVVAYQNYPFLTASGLPFHYELKRGRNGQINRELLIDRRTESKSLTWSSVRSAFRKVDGEEVPFVERPKALGDIRGVSYIYPMFFRFGMIEVPDKYREKMAG